MKRYKHYKGGTYTMLGIGKHTETGEELVSYSDEDGELWFRPKDMFFGTVVINGSIVPRFERV